MSAELDNLTLSLLDKLAVIGAERVSLRAQVTKLKDEVEEVAEIASAGPELRHEEVLRELADVVIVCVTAARVLGYPSGYLYDHVLAKARVNAQREWFATASGTARHTPE